MTRSWVLVYSVTCLSVAAVAAAIVPGEARVLVIAAPPAVVTLVREPKPPPTPPPPACPPLAEPETTHAPPTESRSPVTLEDLPRMIDVIARDDRTCALAAEGTVYCWGAGVTDASADVWSPKRLTHLAGVVQIAASTIQCALVRGGRLHCDPADESTPDLEGVRAVFAGPEDVCAVMENGAVRCAGHFAHDFLMPDDPSPNPSQWQPIRGLFGVKELSIGRQMFARLSDGSIRWWGSTNVCWGEPRTTAAFFPLAGVERLLDDGCATLKSGSVRCWGVDSGGAPTLTPKQWEEPRRSPPLADVRQIAVSSESIHEPPRCALTGDGVVHCWGPNIDGMFGDATFREAAAPMPIRGWGNVKRIALGNRHTCVVRDDGSVACAGSNAHGQLGVGSARERE